MDDREREELLDALIDRLRSQGAPQGVWLVDIAQARQALQAADSLLMRLHDALIDGLSPLD